MLLAALLDAGAEPSRAPVLTGSASARPGDRGRAGRASRDRCAPPASTRPAITDIGSYREVREPGRGGDLPARFASARSGHSGGWRRPRAASTASPGGRPLPRARRARHARRRRGASPPRGARRGARRVVPASLSRGFVRPLTASCRCPRPRRSAFSGVPRSPASTRRRARRRRPARRSLRRSSTTGGRCRR